MTDPAIPSLISRLEAASENDVALFMDVYDAVTPSPTDDGTRTTYLSGGLRFLACLRCDAFLDAITALIERALPSGRDDTREPPRERFGWTTSLAQRFDWNWNAQLYRVSDGLQGNATAPTPALALCLALVRAKAAQEKQEE